MTEVVLDAALKAIVDARGSMFSADLESMPLEQAMRIARPSMPAAPPPPHTEDRSIPGYRGALLPIRIYRPPAATAKLPILMHLHGGGFVAGSIALDDARCHALSEQVPCVVVSVEYSLAPEQVFPTAIEEAFAVWNWIEAHAASFGGDATRRAVSGSSAGGHIAIGVSLLARARGARMPLLQLLTYPVIDPSLETESYRAFSDGPLMTKARMAWYWKQYGGGSMNGHAGELWSPLTSQAAGLPPAQVITAEYDVLRDEGEAFAAHLRSAGIAAKAKRYPRMVHGFLSMLPGHDESVTALRDSVIELRKAFGL